MPWKLSSRSRTTEPWKIARSVADWSWARSAPLSPSARSALAERRRDRHLLDDRRLGPALVQRVGEAVVVVAAHQHGAEDHDRDQARERVDGEQAGARAPTASTRHGPSLGLGGRFVTKLPAGRDRRRCFANIRGHAGTRAHAGRGAASTPVDSPPTSVTKRDPGVTDIHPMSEEGPQGERGAAGVRAPGAFLRHGAEVDERERLDQGVAHRGPDAEAGADQQCEGQSDPEPQPPGPARSGDRWPASRRCPGPPVGDAGHGVSVGRSDRCGSGPKVPHV